MRRSLLAAASVSACAGALLVSQVLAQRPAANPPSRGLAIIDTSVIVVNSTRLKAARETLKADAQAKEEYFKKESARFNQITDKVRAMPEGSPERKKQETEVLKMRADFDLQGKKAEVELREKETKVLATLSADFQAEVARYAKANNLSLVLRHEPTPTDLSNPQAISNEIRKPIVYQRAPDITPAVVEAVNRRASTASTPRTPTR